MNLADHCDFGKNHLIFYSELPTEKLRLLAEQLYQCQLPSDGDKFFTDFAA